MSKKLDFINWIEELMTTANVNENDIPENVKLYWDAFRNTTEKEKPQFTDNGKLILKFLQDNQDQPMWKSRDIAEGLFISSRTVSGAIRKLVSDGYVEKIGQDPVIYSLTNNGKNVKIEM